MQFEHLQRVEALYLTDGSIVGPAKGREIIVCIEPGQQAGVPWFAVFAGERLVSKFNGAHIEGVRYPTGETT